MSASLILNHGNSELSRLRRRLDRERNARLEAEQIAEHGMRELYLKQRQLQLLEAIAVKANQSSNLTEVLQFAIQQVCQFTD